MNSRRFGFDTAKRISTYYHGSPYGGLVGNFDRVRPPVFFTKHYDVALDYASPLGVGCAQDDPGTGGRQPTVYTVKVDAGKVFDFRKSEIRALYEKYRAERLRGLDRDDEDRYLYPPIDSEGFIHSHTGVPAEARVRWILDLFREHGHRYDSALASESAQGVSLMLLDPVGRTKIVDVEEIPLSRWGR